MHLKDRKVLVLNKGWKAIGVVNLDRAIVMLFSCYENTKEPKARIIDPARDFQTYTWEDWSKIRPRAGEDVIRSATGTFCIPEVILLSRYEKIPQLKVHFSRRTIYKRDSYSCQYCGCTPGVDELTIEHVLPRSRGGKTTWENCVLACVPCNSRKANRTPEECGMKLLKQPKKPLIPLFRGDIKVKSWEAFLGEMYWQTELENDNED